jgi:hypothetical protein
VLTWDDSTGARRRGRLGRPRAGRDRIVTFRSGIAFPSAHDHGALCPRQARSTQVGQTLRWLSDRKRTTIRNSTPPSAGATAGSDTRSPAAPGLPRPGGPCCSAPAWPARLALLRPTCPARRVMLLPACPGPAPLALLRPAACAALIRPALLRPACPALIRLARPGSRPAGKNGRARCHMPAPPRCRTGGGSSRAGQASPAGIPKPGPTGLGPPKARLPLAVAGDGLAPPVAAAVPPTSFYQPGTASSPAINTPRRCPGRINPPEPAGVEANWRTDGVHVENPPPPWWRFPAGRPK